MTAIHEAGDHRFSRLQEKLEEASEALGTAMGQLRIAEAGLRTRDRELEAARLELQAERRRYRDLLDSAPIGTLVTDPEGIVVEANRAAATLLGAGSPAALEGHPLADSLVEADRPAFRDEMRLAIGTGDRREWVALLRRDDGSPMAAVMMAAVVPAPEGRPLAVRWFVRESGASRTAGDRPAASAGEAMPAVASPSAPGGDELGRERTARLMAEAEASWLRELIHGIDAIVWEADPAGWVRFVSRRAEELLGYPSDRWLGDSGIWPEIVHPEDREWAMSHRRRSLNEGRDGELEYRVVAPDGRVVWLRESVRAVRDPDGRVMALRGSMWNIGKRKKVERQLYTARRELAEQLADVTYLHELSRRLWEAPDLMPLLGEILAATTSIQGAEMGLVRLYVAARNELDIVASVGLPPEYLERYGQATIDEVTCGLAIERGESVVIEDVENDPIAAPYRDSARLGGIRAEYSTILVSRGGELLGTIATFFREPYRPPERQVRLVDLFARQAADFVENAKLHRELREADRRKDEAMADLSLGRGSPLEEVRVAIRFLQERDDVGPPSKETLDQIAHRLEGMARLVDDLSQGASGSVGDERVGETTTRE